jgi:hypothetical protein
MTERTFPVLKTGERNNAVFEAKVPDAVPWDFLAPHEARAKQNHYQSLETLAHRGGLDIVEILAVVEDKTWRAVSHVKKEEALSRVLAHLETWKQKNPISKG